MSTQKPEIANSIQTGAFKTNYHDYGEGYPVLLIHGSGPGVTSWANWNKVMPILSKNRRVLALDMVGFGYTERPEGIRYTMDGWTQQIVDFLDAMGIEQADVVGNSFGGAMALALAIKHPKRVRKLVLMGSMGIEFSITHGLDAVWGYTPSVKNMAKILDLFVYNKNFLSDDLAKSRYEASIEPGFQESFSAMFPKPRQDYVKAMAKYEDKIKNIKQPALIIHGRDDQVIPVENATKLMNMIEDSQVHIFGKCGHWTQIEHTQDFCDQVEWFLSCK